ncbi:aldo/keto reductase [Methanobrevibacter sp.]|uniref:aldo/keto reductase n=1 Tax=Methanobrevibacter sp. TaxID=66852 RepID=UPI0025FF53AB|nr:aldo/keto reductase [Methanobrevibacter sp.]MBQ6100065.1 aldo/keto reductase [Methanobrevibacter sp.]MBQ6511964.1 aldo/keto reductase [Methanobrevibacter sp.]
MKFFKLNDGNEIPSIGFGTFLIPADGSTYNAVSKALEFGVRHIDTAAAYFNEEEVGCAVRDSEIDREDIWITSKMWLQDYKYEDAKKAIDISLKKLQTDYMDLYLLHQPYGAVDEAWRVLEEAKEEGKIKSIGVSNMTPKLWNRFVPEFDTVPSVNQVEFNPYFQQKEIREIMAKDDVKLESWGPLGQGSHDLLTNPVIVDIADKYGKNAGQVILRFENQEGIIVFPKSTKDERIKSNMDIFDFKLTDVEMDKIRALDTGKGSHDPDAEGVGEMLLSAFDVHAND